MLADDFVGIIESQPVASGVMNLACRHSVELLEDMALVLARDTEPVVAALYYGVVCLGVGSQRDFDTFARVFYGVVNQRREYLSQVHLVGSHLLAVGALDAELDALLLAERYGLRGAL